MTEGNAAAILDNGGNAVSDGTVGADAVSAVVGIIGTASDGDAGVVSTYY